MATHVNIADRKYLNRLLGRLTPGTVPAWGKLAAQNMIEHLADAVDYTNGNKTTVLEVSLEEAQIKKQIVLHVDFVLPKGIKGPDDGLEKLMYPNLTEAIKALNRAIDDFEKYFQTKNITSMHPGFGPLNQEEWLLFHGKHFGHHFMQFGLLD
jgi:Protein of unknown function (DUF1569)